MSEMRTPGAAGISRTMAVAALLMLGYPFFSTFVYLASRGYVEEDYFLRRHGEPI